MGYRKEQVTCYMNAAAHHIPQMVEKNDNIKQFCGQGKNLEKLFTSLSSCLTSLEIYV